MAEIQERQRYQESDKHVPDPTHAFGTLDTSGTAGGAHQRVEEVTPIFDVAKQQDMQVAARALDPDDDSVPASLVNIPRGQHLTVIDEEALKRKVTDAARKAEEDPVDVFAPTSSQVEAAQTGDEGAEIAQAQQEGQGVGTSGDPDGLSRQTGDGDDETTL